MFHVSESNPNQTAGGNGCLCHPNGGSDTAGPFAVFPATDVESFTSPHAVLCLGCAEQFCKRAQDPGEILDMAEPAITIDEADIIAETDVPTQESPVHDDEEIEL